MLEQASKHSVTQSGMVGIASLIFFAVLVWSANKPVTMGDGTEVWQYSVPGIVTALLVACFAPFCTFVSAPFRDQANRVRTAAIMSWFGMLLVWAISVTEFVAQSGVEGRLLDKFGIDADSAWMLNIVIFGLGVCLFAVFNHVYRDAKSNAEFLKNQMAETDSYKHVDQAVTQLEKTAQGIVNMKTAEMQFDSQVNKVTPETIKKLADAKHHTDMQAKLLQLLNSSPHPHAGKRAHEEHKAQIDKIRNALNPVITKE